MTSSQANSHTKSTKSTPAGWFAPVALLLAVIAVGLAGWSLVRGNSEPAAAAPPTFTSQQTSDAKTRTCGAFDTVRKAVTIQTNSDLGPDPVAKEAVAANARLAILGGGQYLLARLDPATPPQIADPVRLFANNLLDIGMNQLLNVPNTDPALAGRLNDAQTSSQQIIDLCK
jgi:hypothetical protein